MPILSLNVLLRKEPFKVALPVRRTAGKGNGRKFKPSLSQIQYQYLSQDDFLAQWDTSGHYIHSREDWKDDFVEDYEENDSPKNIGVSQGKNKVSNSSPKLYRLQRRAFPLQRMIHKKRVSHLCTNPTKFQIKRTATNSDTKKLLVKYKEHWTDDEMETAKFKLISEAGKVGDSAIYVYRDGDDIKWKIFSYSYGDVLFEHRNRKGERIAFARQYKNTYIDENGEEQTGTFVDVFTKNEDYTLDAEGNLAQEYDDYGNKVDIYVPHMRGFISVAYLRMELPFWEPVQDLIDDFELLMSMIGEYNTRQAFQMLLIKNNSGKISIKNNGLGGTSILRIGQEDDASFMGKLDAANSLFTEIDNIYSGILDGSGVVPPMQSSSGDRPTGTTAMYYEPEMEWARNDAQNINMVINELANIYKYYVGALENDATGYNALKINASIKPYSYIDFTDWNSTLISLVEADIVSRETAREESDFASNAEDMRMEEQSNKENEMEARLNANTIIEETDIVE